jgi:hypothetical protein
VAGDGAQGLDLLPADDARGRLSDGERQETREPAARNRTSPRAGGVPRTSRRPAGLPLPARGSRMMPENRSRLLGKPANASWAGGLTPSKKHNEASRRRSPSGFRSWSAGGEKFVTILSKRAARPRLKK